MFFDRLLDLLLAAVQKLGAKLDSLIPDPPGWVAQAPAMIATVLGYATSLGNWVPVGLFAAVTASVVVCLVAGFAIKVARIVASFVTLGGGGAG